MLTKLVIWLLFSKCIVAQLDGKFWWTNKKISELNGKEIPPPQFEELSEFDTDDTRIIFDDNNFNPVKHSIVSDTKTKGQFMIKLNRLQTKKKKMVDSQDKINSGQTKMDKSDRIVWPSDDRNSKNFKTETSTNRFSKIEQTTKKAINLNTQHQSAIKFPERDFFYVKEPASLIIATMPATQTSPTTDDATTPSIKNTTETIHYDYTDRFAERKSICTYIKKKECMKSDGFIYTTEYGKSPNLGPKDPTLVCCILSEPTTNYNGETYEVRNVDSTINFPDNITPNKRYKRSDDELRQRDILLKRNRSQERRPKLATKQTKEISAEDAEDPYWNIKNSNLHPSRKPPKAVEYDYKEDYVQEYADELPKPGLVGIYSDNGRRPVSWNLKKHKQSYGEEADYDEVDDSGTSFGYGAIDPRQDDKRSKKAKQPTKLANVLEKKYEPESQIITFQSNPNFEVLQGFKLLNLVRNKNKMSKRTNEQSDESGDGDDTVASTIATSPTSISNFKENLQLFSGCGQSSTPTKLRQKDVQIGDAEQGSHTWLIVVTPTNDPDDILCYGTLIHPRAAITAADCVYDPPPDGITVMAGLWKLNEKTNARKRTPAVHLHPKFRPGSIAHNLAILSWTRPFKLCDEIQTACLAEPRQGKDCMMYGWGGFDQALRLRSRWQRTRIHDCNQTPFASKGNVPNNAFCASVQSRGTVSGVGGPMICSVNGRDAIVGVAISRDTEILVLPVKEWAIQAEQFLGED